MISYLNSQGVPHRVLRRHAGCSKRGLHKRAACQAAKHALAVVCSLPSFRRRLLMTGLTLVG